MDNQGRHDVNQVDFVGAGPGDPELITVKGARLLREADVVVYAGSLVNRELLALCCPAAVVYDSAGMTLDEAIGVMAEAVAGGSRVVRLHTGDPALYGAIQEQMAALEALGIPCRVTPGVTSAAAAAAALKQELTLPEVSQTVILTRLAGKTPVPERERLAEIARIGATLVIYLSVGMIDKVVEELLAGGYTRETPAAVVFRASWPDERIVEGTLDDIAGKVAEAGIHRQALILVGEVLGVRRDGLKARSLLYDGAFSHGYRQGMTG
jgi:precorrin-4/cobalt-precorrin-4 C11-methyltransferase